MTVMTVTCNCSGACSISDTTSVVITGGLDDGDPISRVSRYNNNGWMEDLPSLNTARAYHGCSLYTTDTGEKVNISTDERKVVLQYFLPQVYVVMGGYDGNSRLSSTEMLSEGEDTWRERAPLPRPLSSLRSVSLGNVIYLTGQMIILRVWSL